MHVEGPFSEFRDDMRTFIQDLLKPSDQPARRWQFCELLLVGFMPNKGCHEIVKDLDQWQTAYQRMRSPDADVHDLIDEFNDMMVYLKPPIFLEELNNEYADGKKQKHTSVFVIDWMVKQYSLEGPLIMVMKTVQNVFLMMPNLS
jgi:hypothetical protein